MRMTLVVAAAALTFAPGLQAQEKGTWEIGGFGRYTRYPTAFDTVSSRNENSYGGGGRLGWFFARNWSLELDGSYNATDLDGFATGVQSVPLGYAPFHLRGIYNMPLDQGGRIALLLGGGIALNHYGKIDVADKNDFGVGGLVGLRARLFKPVYLRIDGLADYTPNVFTGETSGTFLGAQAGLSLLFGGGPCRDRLESISLTPASATLFAGQTQQFSATGTLCDGSTTTPAVVTYTATGGAISAGGNFTAGSGPGSYMVIVSSGRYADTSMVTVRANTPASVTLTPPSATLDTGGTQQFSATLRMADGTTRPVTNISGTGGTVSSGLYRAGTSPGSYLVIATAEGLADSSTVTIRQPPPPPTVNIVLNGAHFAFDRYSLSPAAQDTLRRVAQTLVDNPSVRIEVAGHTDWVGTTAYNMRLSQARAESVRRFLASNGVAADRITVTYFGEERPVADNRTAEGRAQNRRVEVTRRP